MKLTFCTIASRNYLSRVTCLAQSVRCFYPNSEFVWIDSSILPGADSVSAGAKIIHGSAIVRDWVARTSRYDVTELATSLKGPAFLYLIRDRAGLIVYFDPDIVVSRALTDLVPLGQASSLLVTPHWASPGEANCSLSVEQLGRLGVFNLGFLAANSNNCDAADAMQWLTEQTEKKCLRAQELGIFGDQKWADFFPSMFAGVTVCRNPKWNVGWWNGANRNWGDAEFCHFSGYQHNFPERPTKHLQSLTFESLHKTAKGAYLEYGMKLASAESSSVIAMSELDSQSDLPYVVHVIARAAGISEITSIEDLLTEASIQRSSHPLDCVLAEVLCSATTHRVLDLQVVFSSVHSWLTSNAGLAALGNNSTVRKSFIAAWRSLSKRVNLPHIADEESDAIFASLCGIDRDSSLSFEERCGCGRAKPGGFR